MPEIQLANAHAAGERRGEHFLGDDGANPLNRGGGGVARGFGGIEIGLGRIAALDQLTLPSERESGVLEHREIVLEIGLLHRIVDFEERSALFDVLARLDPDRRRSPRRFAARCSISCTARKVPIAGRRGVQVSTSGRGDRDRSGRGRRRKDEAFIIPGLTTN